MYQIDWDLTWATVSAIATAASTVLAFVCSRKADEAKKSLNEIVEIQNNITNNIHTAVKVAVTNEIKNQVSATATASVTNIINNEDSITRIASDVVKNSIPTYRLEGTTLYIDNPNNSK